MADIVQLKKVGEKECTEINILLRQFNDKETSIPALETILANPMTELWTVEDSGKIVGMATLALIPRTAGITARIEDVILDEGYRGKGLGKELIKKLIERAKTRSAYSIHLTSNPKRESANALYKKLGFEQRETNVFRLEL